MQLHLNPFRTYPRIIGLFFFLMFTAIGIILFMGFFPIVKVDSSWVLAKDLDRTMQVADNYYQSVKKTYNLKDPEKAPSRAQLKATILSTIIEDRLIELGAKRELGSDFDRVLALRLAEVIKDKESLEAGQALYGLRRDDFIREVLVPSLRADILESRLFMESKDLDGWLEEEKKKASVNIYSSDYIWNGEVVEVK